MDIAAEREQERRDHGDDDVTGKGNVTFRLFTFLLDKNGQLNYNIDITELIHSSAGPDHLIAGA